MSSGVCSLLHSHYRSFPMVYTPLHTAGAICRSSLLLCGQRRQRFVKRDFVRRRQTRFCTELPMLAARRNTGSSQYPPPREGREARAALFAISVPQGRLQSEGGTGRETRVVGVVRRWGRTHTSGRVRVHACSPVNRLQIDQNHQSKQYSSALVGSPHSLPQNSHLCRYLAAGVRGTTWWAARTNLAAL